jgi:hypothetical protein
LPRISRKRGAHPDCRLSGNHAREFIGGVFVERGVAAGRLAFVHAGTEDYIERARQFAFSAQSRPNPQFRARIKAAGLNDPQAFAQGFAANLAALFAQ